MADSASPLLGTIPEADRQLREHIRAFALGHAEPWHREHLTRLYQVWEDANAKYYGGVMIVPSIQLLEPSAPDVLGECSAVSGNGASSQIRIRPSLLTGTHPAMMRGNHDPEGAFRFVADVLIHEQIHQWQQEITGKTEECYRGHGPTFCARCNEIGATLGLDEVMVRTRPGHRDQQRCPQWPHNVRPRDYYLGAYVPVKRDHLEQKKIEEAIRLLESRGYTVVAPDGGEVFQDEE